MKGLGKIIFLKTIVSLSVFLCLPNISNADNINFVKNGEAKGVIVTNSNNSDIVSAAKELQTVIKKSSGVNLPITSTPQAGKNTIRITTYKEKRETRDIVKDGFKIYSPTASEIVIQGGDEIGAANGVYHFLEKNLGVRWLQPGDDWTHVPKQQTVSFPDTSYIEEPDFFSRSWFSGGDIWTGNDQKYISWRKRMGIMDSNNARAKYHHSLDKMFKPSIYCNRNSNPSQYHPEWYPVVSGVAQCSNSHVPSTSGFEWEPVLSNQDLVAEAIRIINKYFDNNPNEDWYSLGMSDNNKWGDGALNGYANATDYYITFVNKVVTAVVAKHPNARFGFLAYKDIKQPPVNVTLHPAVLPVLTYERTRWALAEGEAKDRELTNGWLAKVSEMGWYDYSYGDVYKIPRIYFHNLSRAFKFAKSAGVTMITSEAYPYTPHWVGGPKAYVYAKLNWDTSMDTQESIAEWSSLAVGDLAKEDLLGYYNFWQDYWENKLPNSTKEHTMHGWPKTTWFKRFLTVNDYMYFQSNDYLDEMTLNDLSYLEGKIINVVKKADSTTHRQRAEFICNSWKKIKSDIYSRVSANGGDSGAGNGLNCSSIQQASCSEGYFGFCTTQSTCTTANGNWCNNQCQSNSCTGGTVIRADVNQDNKITTTDALLTLKKSVDYDLTRLVEIGWHISITTGDVNCDGEVSATDAMLILKKAVGGRSQSGMEAMGWCEGN